MGIVLAFLAAHTPARGEIVEAIVATVGSEVILRSEVMAEISPFLEELKTKAMAPAAFQREARQAYADAVETAVEQRILARQAKILGLEVPDEMVEEWLGGFQEQFSSNKEFLRWLETQGLTAGELRERRRQQILALSMGAEMRQDFEKEIVISESEIQDYYEEHKTDYTIPERVRLRQIFLAAGNDPGQRAQIRARLALLREELALGAEFPEYARAYSEGPKAAEGGLIGEWTRRDQLVPELDTPAFTLPEGGLSAIIETQFGFTLLKVEKKERETVAALAGVRGAIEPELRNAHAMERYRKWLASLRKRSRVRTFL